MYNFVGLFALSHQLFEVEHLVSQFNRFELIPISVIHLKRQSTVVNGQFDLSVECHFGKDFSTEI